MDGIVDSSTVLLPGYSLINMRQLQILFNHTKTWHPIICWFIWIYLFLLVLAWCVHKIVSQIKTKQFYDHKMQELVKTGKFNKQSHTKFWFTWIKFEAISYWLSCIRKKIGILNAYSKLHSCICNRSCFFSHGICISMK